MEELLARGSVLLLDAYGVLVDGSGALPGAPELIRRLNARGRPYFVLTNDASKLPSTGVRRYRGMGLELTEERMITSGGLLEAHFRAHHLVGARCLVLGPEDSKVYVRRAGGEVVELEDAAPSSVDVLVIGDESGYPFLEGLDAALTLAFAKMDRGAPLELILPNPDLIYPQSPGRFGFASGGVALLLEAALKLRYPGRQGTTFTRLGKPFAPIFEAAVERAGTRDLIMVGDQLETDIRGARAFGIPSVLVQSGITRPIEGPLPPEIRPDYLLAAP